MFEKKVFYKGQKVGNEKSFCINLGYGTIEFSNNNGAFNLIINGNISEGEKDRIIEEIISENPEYTELAKYQQLLKNIAREKDRIEEMKQTNANMLEYANRIISNPDLTGNSLYLDNICIGTEHNYAIEFDGMRFQVVENDEGGVVAIKIGEKFYKILFLKNQDYYPMENIPDAINNWIDGSYHLLGNPQLNIETLKNIINSIENQNTWFKPQEWFLKEFRLQ